MYQPLREVLPGDLPSDESGPVEPISSASMASGYSPIGADLSEAVPADGKAAASASGSKSDALEYSIHDPKF